ncbi:PAS domain-containing sensor histidine kinase [Fundidesulfovibrio terrae]|uniref:PAS domain-containing sensor histidine kinase n=1 Tax=Fundidesulfovibrio terrae TaxID=2922866 RepID=UPI001FAEFEC5|nr:PAS domain-containing sensor histidine kinase [Fundidesulfovibrio terrae]
MQDTGNTVERLTTELETAHRRIAALESARQECLHTGNALQESEERLRFALEGANDGLWDANLKTDEFYMSRRGCAILGYTQEEVRENAKIWKDLVYRDDLAATTERLADYLEGRAEIFQVEQRLKTKSGGLKWVLTRGKAVEFDEAGNPLRMTGTHTDISARKEAEEALKQSEARYRMLVDCAGDAIYLADGEGRLVDVNSTAQSQTQFTREELLRMRIADVDAEYDHESTQKMLAGLDGTGGEVFQTRHRRKDGSTFPVEVRVVALELAGRTVFMGIARDITERQNMQEVLIQTEKMISVGGLAAGMAHEINNPLGGILQSVQVLRRRLTEDSPANLQAARDAGCSLQGIREFMDNRGILAFLDNVRDAGTRATRIVSSMLEFSRKSEPVRTATDVNGLLDDTVALCATEYNLKKKYDFRKIPMERDYAPDLPQLPCSRPQIQQVVMNILGNAAHALAGSPSPRITLRTRRDDGFVRIEIQDNGPGMDDAVRRKIFEPFFTTKPVGEGTGLGLSVSYFIVTSNHRGTLEVNSDPGQGSTFTIRLPLEPGPAGQQA